MNRPKRVIVESPYKPYNTLSTATHKTYALACMRDSLRRGEAPFLSHLFYTQILNDEVYEERQQGMKAGWSWMESAELVAVYINLGVSKGMREGMVKADQLKIPIAIRLIKDLTWT